MFDIVPYTSLILPIVLSAVIVFVASSIIHMLLGYHKNDFRPLPDENGVLEALQSSRFRPATTWCPAPRAWRR